jgi:Zn-dependent protease
MLLADPSPSPLDLRFRLFGTDVRVHPLFWLITALFGWSWSSLKVLPGNGLGEVALWIACVFVSILLHEFGHVWMGRVFGARGGHIVLQSMGGLAIGAANVPYRWQRILVSAAGPGIQLALFGILYGLLAAGYLPWPKGGRVGMGSFFPSDGWQVCLIMMLVINLFWPVLNLLPIYPLDGGQMTREFFQIVSPRQGLVVSLWLSVIVAGALCANALVDYLRGTPLLPYVGHYFSSPFMAVFFGLFAFSSFQALASERRKRTYFWEDDDQPPWRPAAPTRHPEEDDEQPPWRRR